tara:strand:+ start:513 stop:1205 length:693 start_codon:yes stop_codon:yes gene_type:complete
MNIKDKYIVKSVKAEVVKEWFLKKHYAQRQPSISYCFELVKEGLTVGVCSFGKPPMPLQREGICGVKNSKYVWELNRLIKNDGLEKNVTSFFVSQCLKLMPRPSIILSYADKDFGHNGYIYQATNFYFVGETQKHENDITVEGMEHLHQSTITDKFRGVDNRMEAIRKEYGDFLKFKKRNQKNRYVFFTGSKTQKKKFKKDLLYKIQKYPKMKNTNYKADYKPSIQTSIF